MSEPVFALFAGGGTGGHTYPAVAVAQELVRRGHPASRCASSAAGAASRGGWSPRRASRSTCSPVAGCNGGSRSTTSPRSWARCRRSCTRWLLVRRYRPRVVVGFGGYASLPCVVAARVLRVPTLVHEQDAAPGLANRIGVRLGARPAVSLPDTPLPDATLTGNPVRSVIAAIEREPGVGSGAARGLRRRAGRAHDQSRRDRLLRPLARPRATSTVHHVCGPRNLDECAGVARRAAASRTTRSRTSSSRYEQHMDDVAGAGDARGVPRRRGHDRRAHRGRGAGGARAAARLAERPPDAQRADARTGGRRGRACATTSAIPPGSTASSRSCSRDPDRLEQMGKAAREPRAARRRRRGSPISSRSTPVPDDARAPASSTCPPLDLTRPRRVHIVGVGGVGHERDRACCSRAWVTR